MFGCYVKLWPTSLMNQYTKCLPVEETRRVNVDPSSKFAWPTSFQLLANSLTDCVCVCDMAKSNFSTTSVRPDGACDCSLQPVNFIELTLIISFVMVLMTLVKT